MDFFDRSDLPPVRSAPSRPCTYAQHAIELLGLPADWQNYSWSLVGPPKAWVGIEVKGGVYRHKITRGPRKGFPDFKKPEPGSEITLTLGILQHEAWRLQWEVETGLCHGCQGRGITVRSAGVSGIFHRACQRCDGTGNARSSQPEA